MLLRELVVVRLLVDDLQWVEQLLKRAESELSEMEESHSRELKLLFIRERIAEACSRLGRIQDFLQTVLTNDDTHEAAIEQLSEGYGEMWES